MFELVQYQKEKQNSVYFPLPSPQKNLPKMKSWNREGKRKEKEQRGSRWDLSSWVKPLLVFGRGMGTVTTADEMSHCFHPMIAASPVTSISLGHGSSKSGFLGLWRQNSQQSWFRLVPSPRLGLYLAAAAEAQAQPRFWNQIRDESLEVEGVVESRLMVMGSWTCLCWPLIATSEETNENEFKCMKLSLSS